MDLGNIRIEDYNKPREVEVPESKETFEAQVLVIAKPYKEMRYPMMVNASIYSPLSKSLDIIRSGNCKVELVMSSLTNGKPMLIITEV